MIAANGGGLKASFPFAPSFMFLSAASVGNTLFAIVIAICYCVFWPLITWLSLLQPTRMLFAYSFDGMLPKVVRVDDAQRRAVGLGDRLRRGIDRRALRGRPARPRSSRRSRTRR